MLSAWLVIHLTDEYLMFRMNQMTTEKRYKVLGAVLALKEFTVAKPGYLQWRKAEHSEDGVRPVSRNWLTKSESGKRAPRAASLLVIT